VTVVAGDFGPDRFFDFTKGDFSVIMKKKHGEESIVEENYVSQ
jgi:hypothetical protein